MRVRLRVGLTGVFGVLTACSLFTHLDGLSGGPGDADAGESTSGEPTDPPIVTLAPLDATAEDAARDQASDGGAGIDAAALCTNLILNGGFEDKDSCDPWSFGSISPTSHSGARACLACGNGFMQLRISILGRTFAPGEHVSVTLWARAADVRLFGLPLTLTLRPPPGAGSIRMSNDYQMLSFDGVVPLDGGVASELDFYLTTGTPADGGCLLLDDVVTCVSGP